MGRILQEGPGNAQIVNRWDGPAGLSHFFKVIIMPFVFIPVYLITIYRVPSYNTETVNSQLYGVLGIREMIEMVFSIMILAISLSLDALGVGVAYGLRKIKIPLIPKLIICFFSIFYSGAALILGKSLSAVLSPGISKLVGIVILSLMGIWIITQALLRKETDEKLEEQSCIEDATLLKIAIKSLGITIQVIKNPVKGDIDRSGTIDISESLLLGLALSIDAIGVGIGSALSGFHSMAIPFSVGLFQLAFLYAGTYFGTKFALSDKINKKALSLLPGILLICLAILRAY